MASTISWHLATCSIRTFTNYKIHVMFHMHYKRVLSKIPNTISNLFSFLPTQLHVNHIKQLTNQIDITAKGLQLLLYMPKRFVLKYKMKTI